MESVVNPWEVEETFQLGIKLKLIISMPLIPSNNLVKT